MSDQARRQMANYRDTAGQKADEWSNDAARFMEEQPLVAGALGIAFGALLGGLLPTSDSERRLAKQAVESESGQQALSKAESAVDEAQREASKKIDEASEVAEQKSREVEESASSGA